MVTGRTTPLRTRRTRREDKRNQSPLRDDCIQVLSFFPRKSLRLLAGGALLYFLRVLGVLCGVPSDAGSESPRYLRLMVTRGTTPLRARRTPRQVRRNRSLLRDDCTQVLSYFARQEFTVFGRCFSLVFPPWPRSPLWCSFRRRDRNATLPPLRCQALQPTLPVLPLLYRYECNRRDRRPG